MGANIIKIKVDKKTVSKKPLSPFQKKLLAGPVMTAEEYKEFRKNNKWMAKWKI